MLKKTGEFSATHFLIELRSRLIFSFIFLFITFTIFIYFSDHLYSWLALPLLRFLPQGHLIATQIVSPFFVPFKLAFMASIGVTVPFLIYQIWLFISPALYSHEKRLLWPFLLLSATLFYAGLSFAYFIIFPLLFHFFSRIVPSGVVFSPDINDYLDFTIKLLFIFGMLFEIPIIMCVLIATRLVSREKFIQLRSYAIVSAFVIGMLLAPPDVLSQTLLAIPIWLLYETGILLSWLMKKYAVLHKNKSK